MEFNHETVLLKETIENLKIKSNGIYVDGTLGGGGHSSEIIKHLDNNGLLIGIDQDTDAIKAAQERLGSVLNNIKLIHNNFSNIKDILLKLEIDKIDGMILDLGVSSYQLDNAQRGFSYMNDAELDMRMNRDRSLTAKYLVNNYSEENLKEIIQKYGEEKWAARIAKFIVEEREDREIVTTGDLVDIIKKAIPLGARKKGAHPAKRTFQAIRIEVNNELNILENTIKDIIKALKTGGRLCIITFHSLEDRIVKNAFKELAKGCICPPEFPICKCDKEKEVKIITKKPICPNENEVEDNPRSRSAKLRVAQRI